MKKIDRKPAAPARSRELRPSELNAVAGGAGNIRSFANGEPVGE